MNGLLNVKLPLAEQRSLNLHTYYQHRHVGDIMYIGGFLAKHTDRPSCEIILQLDESDKKWIKDNIKNG
jgi:hypothetical protein